MYVCGLFTVVRVRMWPVHHPVKCVPAFGPFAVLSVWSISLLSISLFFRIAFDSSFTVSHVIDLPHFAVAICMLRFCRWHVGSQSKSLKWICTHVRSVPLRLSWNTFISCIDRHYEQVMAEYLVYHLYIYLYINHHIYTGHVMTVVRQWVIIGYFTDCIL